MAYPQIIYDAGSGPVTLGFTFPNVGKPGYNLLKAERNDAVSFSGLRQSMLERVDEFMDLTMSFAPIEDMADWGAFVKWALAGAPFKFYPDAEQPDFSTWTLEDTDWRPKLSAIKGVSQFTLKLRAYVAPPPFDVENLAVVSTPGDIGFPNSTKLALTWDAPEDVVATYEIRYSGDPAATPAAWGSSFVAGTLGPGTSYTFLNIPLSIYGADGAVLIKAIAADGQYSISAAVFGGTWNYN